MADAATASETDVPDEAEEPEETGYHWRNWSREQKCRPAIMARPHTREGMIEAIVDATEAGRKIKVAGSGHSFTPAALTDGTMLRLEGMHRLLEVDRAGNRVKAEAGISLHDLNRRLDRHGMALENLGDIDKQTLAGAISTATHGTGARWRNLSSQVEAMEIVTADGVLHEITGGDELLAARVGLGALGAIYSVTMRTVPSFRIDRVDRSRPLEEVISGMDQLAAELDHFEFYVFPYTDTALCRESTRTDAAPDPPSAASTYAQEVMLENWVAGAFANITRFVPASVPTLSKLAAAGTGVNRKLDHSFRVFASERRVKFTEMEYCVPRGNAREAVEGVLEIANRRELGVAFPIEVRFVAADDAILSPSFERDSAYVAVHYNHRGGHEPYFDAVESLMKGFGGRPHWGKRHTRDAADLRGLYPRFSDFLEVRNRLDPGGAFANEYTERVLGPVVEPVKGKKRRRKKSK